MSDIERVGRVRKGRREAGYTVIQNTLITHPDLSIEARGLMIYLLSRPDDWELRVSDVRRFLGCGGKPCGRDKGYKILNELKQKRYVVMCENVIEQHFAGVTYYIFDEPVLDVDDVRRKHAAGEDALNVRLGNPLPENKEAGQLPLPCFPHPENTEAILSNDYIQTTEIPLTPTQRKTRRRKGSGVIRPSVDQASVIRLEPWSIGWTELRIRRLMKGREVPDDKIPTTRTIQAIMDKGGELARLTRLERLAKHGWPTVNHFDLRAVEFGAGAPMSADVAIDVLALASSYKSVSVTSAEFERWQQAHRDRGWPVYPTPTRATQVWLPKAGVAALDMPNDARAA